MPQRQSIPCALAILGLVLSFATGTLLAQNAPAPQRILVNTVVVKPEGLAMYQDLIRNDAVPAYKKAAVPWRWVFATGGPIGQGFTFVSVSPVANFAEFDKGSSLRRGLGDAAFEAYNAKLRATLVSTNNVVETLVQNASLLSFASTPPNLVTVQTVVLQQGKGADWASITASEFLPVLKKAGVTDYWVYTNTFGAPGNVRTIVQPLANYAALDAGPPLNKAIGAEAAAKLNQKRNALVTSTETTVMRYVPELSFGIPQRPKS